VNRSSFTFESPSVQAYFCLGVLCLRIFILSLCSRGDSLGCEREEALEEHSIALSSADLRGRSRYQTEALWRCVYKRALHSRNWSFGQLVHYIIMATMCSDGCKRSWIEYRRG
jgi:hypothetical protein